MAQIYVWRPEGIAPDEADGRFTRAIAHHRDASERMFGREFQARRHRVGDVYIGSISTDLGVLGWSPWSCRSGSGLAWSGVCEDMLGGTRDRQRVKDTAASLLDRPAAAAGWRGSFAAVAWDDEARRVSVVTGAAQSQTLWHTEGPNGWACGSRARPLLDLVGRSPEIDSTQASLFVSFGYLAGTGALFRGVQRLPSRRHVAIEPGKPVVAREYIDLPTFLHGEDLAGRPFDEIIQGATERYAERVAWQHDHSRAPVVSLTGGRDSRSIAAALTHTSFSGPTRTGGLVGSEDVVLARDVARALGFSHEHEDSEVDFVERLHRSFDRAVVWSWFSEGVETIRHALHYDDFFTADAPFRGAREQSFNGLRPFLNRRHSPGWQRDDLRATIRSDVHHREDALEHFDHVAVQLDRAVSQASGNPNHFADLHFWQVKVLHSGQDNALVKDLFSLWWTPLLDPAVIRANWHLPTDVLPRATFIESMTRTLAPQLERIPYAGSPRGPLHKLVRRIRRKLPRPFRPTTNASFAASESRWRFWEEVLFERDAIVWKDLVEPSVVRRMVDSDRGDHLLWSLATIELFARAHLGTDYAGPARAPSRTPMAADGSP